jgi:hypothetical protein
MLNINTLLNLLPLVQTSVELASATIFHGIGTLQLPNTKVYIFFHRHLHDM